MSVHAEYLSGTLDPATAAGVLERARRLALLSDPERAQVLSLFAPEFPFAAAVAAAASVHLHVKVEDTRALPHEAIRTLGGAPQSAADGYIKYAFPGGINLIFSSINISEDDLLAGEPVPTFPVLDHTGIDLRAETGPVQAAFDAIPTLAGEHGWRHVPQGGAGTPVYCCHTEVKGKHWVYPPSDARTDRPVEIAFGQLGLHEAKMGCDLRPIDPHTREQPRPATRSRPAPPATPRHRRTQPPRTVPHRAPPAPATTNGAISGTSPTWATTPSR